MLIKILSRLTLLIIIIVGAALYPTLIYYFTHKNNSVKFSTPITKNNYTAQEQLNYGLPVRLKIPKIKVDSSIEYLGLTPDGTMAVPKGPDNVVWLDIGQRPGENGTAVMAGHYGWQNGKPSIFDNLYKLRKGDELYVEDDQGLTIVFKVRENRRYDPNTDATNVFTSNDGKAHLNLITCEGDWDKISKNYSTRLVIFADKE